MLSTNILSMLLVIFNLLLNSLSIIFSSNQLMKLNLKTKPFLNSLKDLAPSSIPTKILKLFMHNVSSQLTELFNISFSHGVFTLMIKTIND